MSKTNYNKSLEDARPSTKRCSLLHIIFFFINEKKHENVKKTYNLCKSPPVCVDSNTRYLFTIVDSLTNTSKRVDVYVYVIVSNMIVVNNI